jgi:hypothetical protein
VQIQREQILIADISKRGKYRVLRQRLESADSDSLYFGDAGQGHRKTCRSEAQDHKQKQKAYACAFFPLHCRLNSLTQLFRRGGKWRDGRGADSPGQRLTMDGICLPTLGFGFGLVSPLY